eukprot:CAMPEP_0115379674 /NCGR_PEP_ID=MMETSP0271-20121206/4651_1 /TAXON_ID=71861 /ORGANISM="Scrippsiella trochoidea, Strain CCMP3099" /LENGTH=155 /DNA_ID=CAMNT_0002802879 /DNA_START=1242 /DNA_END=1707 /DNA_ORIENTATION=+
MEQPIGLDLIKSRRQLTPQHQRHCDHNEAQDRHGMPRVPHLSPRQAHGSLHPLSFQAELLVHRASPPAAGPEGDQSSNIGSWKWVTPPRQPRLRPGRPVWRQGGWALQELSSEASTPVNHRRRCGGSSVGGGWSVHHPRPRSSVWGKGGPPEVLE